MKRLPKLAPLVVAACLPLAVAGAEYDDEDDPYDDLAPPPILVAPDVPPSDADPGGELRAEPQPLPERPPAAESPAEPAAPDRAWREPAPPAEPMVSDGARRAWQVAAGFGASLSLTVASTVLAELVFLQAFGEGIGTSLVLTSYVGGAALGVHLAGRALLRDPHLPWGPTLRGAALGGLIGATAGFLIFVVPAVSCLLGGSSCDALVVAAPIAFVVGFGGPVAGALYGFEQSLARSRRRAETSRH